MSHISAVGLDAEAEDIVGDGVLGDCDIGLIVHADTNEEQARSLCNVSRDESALGTDSKDAICGTIGDGVASNFGIDGTNNSNVDTLESLDLEAFDCDIPDILIHRGNLSVLLLKFGKIDFGSNDADAGDSIRPG